jgi:cupin fold WbuC family metalloprotein
MKVFTSQYFKNLILGAVQSNRLRLHVNVHNSHSEPCQKLFNAINTGSYIRPHRHSLDPKTECLLAVKGLFAFISFTNRGEIKSINLFGSEKYSEKLLVASGLELSANVWHTVISLVDESILFEVKEGPFNSSISKEFAPWAPEEGGPDAAEYLNLLQKKCRDKLK